MVLVFVLIWVKSVLRCLLYIFHLSEYTTISMNASAINYQIEKLQKISQIARDPFI